MKHLLPLSLLLASFTAMGATTWPISTNNIPQTVFGQTTFAQPPLGSGSGLTNVNATTASNLTANAAGIIVFTNQVMNTNPVTGNYALYNASSEVRSNATTGAYFLGTNGSGNWVSGAQSVAVSNGNVTASGTVTAGSFNGNALSLIGTQWNTPIIKDYYLPGTMGYNLFVGENAGNYSLGSVINSNFGSYNVGVGVDALTSISTGWENTAVGRGALHFNTDGEFNSALGEDALWYNMVGSMNTALGQKALFSNVSGSNNTAVGASALWTSTGGQNTAVGHDALENTTGSQNTVVGDYALVQLLSGSYNTGLGQNIGNTLTTGTYNTLLGQGANVGANGTSYATALGYGVTATNSHDVVLGGPNEHTIVPGSLWILGPQTNIGNVSMLGTLSTGGFTNTGLTASRFILTDSAKGEVSATASGAVPINANGTATTFSQLQSLGGTNLSTMAPDFNKSYSAITTNADFTFLSPLNVSSTLPQTAVIIVTGSGSAVAVQPPLNVTTRGTWYLTNKTVFTFFNYGGTWTNAIALPIN